MLQLFGINSFQITQEDFIMLISSPYVFTQFTVHPGYFKGDVYTHALNEGYTLNFFARPTIFSTVIPGKLYKNLLDGCHNSLQDIWFEKVKPIIVSITNTYIAEPLATIFLKRSNNIDDLRRIYNKSFSPNFSLQQAKYELLVDLLNEYFKEDLLTIKVL